MLNEGAQQQVSLHLLLSIRPLQTADISLGMLHPQSGIPLSPHTQPEQPLYTLYKPPHTPS